ncbi:hypothetical protein PPYR_00059 [Photinus pyralis]|uniref:Peptidase metallopeptidase domain-containing protein n=1 Tax=Photinus pyralis TaxID=7054 RepID=A0A5N4B0G7_PHOPY|nr:matrix metalloproteinase-9-like [Photinus pyralis]KAB0803089.1 hypothetical protein PPYR_00059 [Photinus pyralis]
MKLVLIAALFTLTYAAPAAVRNNVLNYLTQFGYLAEAKLNNPLYVVKAIKKLQRMAHIPETGVIDEATIEFTNTPRCGVPDFENSQLRAFVPMPWSKRNLTYYLGNKSRHLTEQEYGDYLKLALDTWGKHAKLNFTRTLVVEDADIVSFFAVRDHGCGTPFDGEGGILAHGFYPNFYTPPNPKNGDIHFDDDEPWTINGHGRYFVRVALHELGHSLGLEHSSVYGAIMFPAASYNRSTELHQDDIVRIQKLYP